MFRKVLVLAPHTDDGEFGCGGAIVKLIEGDVELYYVAFSVCEKSVPPGLPKNILEVELKEATKELGIKKENLIIYRFPVRELPKYRQNILEELVKIKATISPDLVFMPSSKDIHQDHKTIYEEGLRAFKTTSILGYEFPWNNLTFSTTGFIYLRQSHIQKKVSALKKYKSQVHRHYAKEEFITSMAISRGVQIGVEYAEAFEVIRWVIK
jgi:LmbE family N-acetylglucosaminyl deacetylase